jgi:hypothetical protein
MKNMGRFKSIQMPLVIGGLSLALGGSVAASQQMGKDVLAVFSSAESVLSFDLTQDVLPRDEIRARLSRYEVNHVSIDSAEGKQKAASSGVFWAPTMIVYRGEKEARRIERCADPQLVAAFLDGKELAQASATGGSGGAAGGASDFKEDQECQTDTLNDAPSGDLDIVRICAAITQNRLRVRLDVSDPPSVQSAPRFNVFIDADDNEDTGYATATFKGADYVLQGGFLYKFKGTTPAEWKFDTVGQASVEVKGTSLRLSVPLNLLSGVGREMRIWCGSQTPKWEPADWAPQDSPLIVAVPKQGMSAAATASPSPTTAQQSASPTPQRTAEPESPEKTQSVSQAPGSEKHSETGKSSTSALPPLEGTNVVSLSDPQGDASPGGLDIVSAQLATAGDKLVIRVECAAAPVLNGIHIFFNSDGDAATGYGDGTRSGADFMIEGNTLYKHQTSVGTAWGWDALGALSPAPQVKGNTVTYTIPRSRIGLAEGEKIKVWFATTDASWNTVDTLPDGEAATYPE